MTRAGFAAFLLDEAGDELVEYALVAAVFAIGVALAITALLTNTGSLASTNETRFSSNMTTPP